VATLRPLAPSVAQTAQGPSLRSCPFLGAVLCLHAPELVAGKPANGVVPLLLDRHVLDGDEAQTLCIFTELTEVALVGAVSKAVVLQAHGPVQDNGVCSKAWCGQVIRLLL